MSKGADTWMAFYPGAYLANTLHLTRAQHGSYFMLILAALKAGGTLPNNDTTLSIIARCTPKEWAAEREIYAAFFDVTDERWRHERVTRELAKAETLTAQRSAAGTASAAKRQRPFNDRSTTVDIPLQRNRTGVDPPLQRNRKPSEPQPDNLNHGKTSDVAASAVGDPDGPPRSQPLPDSAIWAERLAGYEPWNGKYRWPWGAPPDAVGRRNPSLSDEQIAAWKARRDAAAKARGEAA